MGRRVDIGAVESARERRSRKFAIAILGPVFQEIVTIDRQVGDFLGQTQTRRLKPADSLQAAIIPHCLP
ncbi:MAG: hypothetical protein AAGE59_10450, partial [Cyanobacteria bacterium P01_F01_bin.86]